MVVECLDQILVVVPLRSENKLAKILMVHLSACLKAKAVLLAMKN